MFAEQAHRSSILTIPAFIINLSSLPVHRYDVAIGHPKLSVDVPEDRFSLCGCTDHIPIHHLRQSCGVEEDKRTEVFDECVVKACYLHFHNYTSFQLMPYLEQMWKNVPMDILFISCRQLLNFLSVSAGLYLAFWALTKWNRLRPRSPNEASAAPT